MTAHQIAKDAIGLFMESLAVHDVLETDIEAATAKALHEVSDMELADHAELARLRESNARLLAACQEAFEFCTASKDSTFQLRHLLRHAIADNQL